MSGLFALLGVNGMAGAGGMAVLVMSHGTTRWFDARWWEDSPESEGPPWSL